MLAAVARRAAAALGGSAPCSGWLAEAAYSVKIVVPPLGDSISDGATAARAAQRHAAHAARPAPTCMPQPGLM